MARTGKNRKYWVGNFMDEYLWDGHGWEGETTLGETAGCSGEE
jgi:hypothetical protein